LLSRMPAGKAVNVSRALAALGVPNVVTGFVGAGELAEFEQALESPFIQPQFLAVDGTTRENITIVDPVNHRETHVRDEGFEVTRAQLDRLAKKLSLLSRPGALVLFSGSLPRGVSAQDFLRLIEVAIKHEARVAIDTSGEALRAVGKAFVDGESSVGSKPARPLWLLKPNVTELGELLGRPIRGDDEIVETGKRLSMRVRAVLVTCGEAGGYAFVDGSALMGQVTVDPVDVVNTVGCGDALLAGFVAGHLRGMDVRDAYRFALAVATAAAVSVSPGQFDVQRVEDFLRRATVEPIERPGPAPRRR